MSDWWVAPLTDWWVAPVTAHRWLLGEWYQSTSDCWPVERPVGGTAGGWGGWRWLLGGWHRWLAIGLAGCLWEWHSRDRCLPAGQDHGLSGPPMLQSAT